MNAARPTSRRVVRIAVAGAGQTEGARAVPEEVPVAFSFLGTTHAVMMATPGDLEDFALGFCLSEAIISVAAEIEQIEIVEADGGIDLQIRLAAGAHDALTSRRRTMAGPAGCGLCGIESIAEALRPVPPVSRPDLALAPADISRAVGLLATSQPLNRETRAVHAAAFFSPRDGVLMVREDVGRHNALDKLIGALAATPIDPGSGAVVLTSRISVELVQKTARLGAPVLIAMSAPTTLALEIAEAAGICVVAIARGDEFEIFTHPERIGGKEPPSHVA